MRDARCGSPPLTPTVEMGTETDVDRDACACQRARDAARERPSRLQVSAKVVAVPRKRPCEALAILAESDMYCVSSALVADSCLRGLPALAGYAFAGKIELIS
jgi:hypothetical protein